MTTVNALEELTESAKTVLITKEGLVELFEAALSTLVTVSEGEISGCEDVNVASIMLLDCTNVDAMLLVDDAPTDVAEDPGSSEVATTRVCNSLNWVVMVTGYVSVTVGNTESKLVALPMSSVTFGVVFGIML